MRRASALPISLLVLCLSGLAEARVRWSTPGAYRLRGTALEEFPLNPEGTDSGQRTWGAHRLRIDPTVELGSAIIRLQLDVLTGQAFGDTTAVGADFVPRRRGDPERSFDGFTTVEPRMLWLELDVPGLRLELGQMGAQWGMGLLDGDGHEAPEGPWVLPFGDRSAGDIVDRVLLATTPLSLFTHRDWGDVVLAVGADYVWQDDQAHVLDEDSAYRLFAQLYYPGEELFAGLYGVRRVQEDSDGDDYERSVLDLYLRWELPIYPIRAAMRLQAEALVGIGESERSATESELFQLGAAGRAEIAWRCPRVAVGVELGYASGDEDPRDEVAEAFTFDPDHRAGFILFSDVLRLVSLSGAERASAAEPEVEGFEEFVTDGAVRNAIYLEPAVTWRPGGFHLSAGMLLAWTAATFVDPAETRRARGARNQRGRDPGRFYGLEGNFGFGYTVAVEGIGEAEIGLQGGLFFPGTALDVDGVDEPVPKLVGRLDLHW